MSRFPIPQQTSSLLPFDLPELGGNITALLAHLFDSVVEIDLETAEASRHILDDELPEASRRDHYDRILADFLMLLHPDDREHMGRVRSLDNLREYQRLGLELEHRHYRMLCRDRYVMMESRGFFITGANGRVRAVLAARRLADDMRTMDYAREVNLFTLALRGTYSEMHELNMRTNESQLIFCNHSLLDPVGVQGLVKTTDIINIAIHADDRPRLLNSFMGESLRARFEGGCLEVEEEFRRLGKDGNYHWVSAVVVPRWERDTLCDNCILLVRDIRQRKEHEQQQRLNNQYSHVLRNIYDGLVECNLTWDLYRITHHTVGKYMTPARNGTLSMAVKWLAETAIHEEDAERFLDFFNVAEIRKTFAEGREYRFGEFRSRRVDGGFLWQSYTMFPLPGERGADEVMLVFIMDIENRKQSEELARQNAILEQQRRLDERYRIVVEQTGTMVFEWCVKTRTRFISPDIALRFAGEYDDRDIMSVWQQDNVIHPADLATFERFLEECVTQSNPEVTVRLRRRNGTFIWCRIMVAWLRDADDCFSRYIGTLNDVNEATCASLTLHYRAEYDMLTGIYNMQAFYTRATQLIRGNQHLQYTIIRMDIDRFKLINDLYGLDEGDRLLKTIARWFSERMDRFSVCGRFSGDIFCMCVHFSQEEVVNLITEFTERLAAYPLTSRVVPSFGICPVDSPETPINALCDRAQLALKTIKGNVLMTHAFYDDILRKRILEEKDIENSMHDALALGQFYIHMQPKVHIATSRIVGAEALVRWQHPTEGAIPPERFIPLFERNGFIIRLDEFVWEETCKHLRAWLDAGYMPPPISVNMSRVHIHDTRLCEKVLALIRKYDLPPYLLEIELTESVFLDNADQLCSTVRQLQSHGFLFLLDDFGSGFSSLNMLKTLPVDVVKLDREFLSEVSATERGKTVIRHTIALAKDLNMRVIAEGVENAEQAKFLYGAGCMMAQGYFYAPPISPTDFAAMAFGIDAQR